jgi:asparagine synthase (glutamine-hydrolysing)
MLLRQGWIPDQHCIWKDVFKLPPGSMLSVQAEDLENASVETLRSKAWHWWSLAAVAQDGQANPLDLGESELDSELDELLRSAVRRRMVADVPLGAFLSGGIDSSTVVALMQAQSSRPIRTFTIGFREAEYDEAAHASEVARHLGTEHTEFRVTPAEVRAVIPELPLVWDEPFADESQIPTLLLSRLARQHVTVALSGDGGDECFGGYARHFTLARLAALFRMPVGVRRLAASALLGLTPQAWQEIARILRLPATLRPALAGGSLRKFARALAAANDQERYTQLTTFGSTPASLDPGIDAPWEIPRLSNAVDQLIYRDMAGYLTGDILVKLDRATMAAGLEGRCPFLDDRVIEFAWRLPTETKIRNGQGKLPLRRLLRRYLPEALFERPKQGFNVPIGEWLTGPLRGWAEELLDGARIRREGLLHSGGVQACWQQHLSGRSDRSGELWAILMVQAWLDSARESKLPLPAFRTGQAAAELEATTTDRTGSLRAYG